MINHFFSTLYNLPAVTSSGIYVPLVEPLRVPDVISGGLLVLRGGTQASAEAFAVHGVKVVDASTYRAEISAVDSRLTYRTDEIGIDTTDSSDFIAQLLQAPGSLQIAVLTDADIYTTFNNPQLPSTDRGAALLIGIVRRINEANAQ
jgi:hypothetical protein